MLGFALELAAETFRVICEAHGAQEQGWTWTRQDFQLGTASPRRTRGAMAKGEADPEIVAIAETIIEHRTPIRGFARLRNRYQDALRELVEGKTKGRATTPSAIAEPPTVINLMEALKRSLAQDAEPKSKKEAASKLTRTKAVPDRRQGVLLLPVSGGGGKTEAAVAEAAGSTAPEGRITLVR
jgi:hypothetical protein